MLLGKREPKPHPTPQNKFTPRPIPNRYPPSVCEGLTTVYTTIPILHENFAFSWEKSQRLQERHQKKSPRNPSTNKGTLILVWIQLKTDVDV